MHKRRWRQRKTTAQDLYAYGVISEIKQVLRVSEDLVKVLVEGKSRAKLLELDASGKYLQAMSALPPCAVRGTADKRNQTEALVRSLKECFEEYLSYSPQISKDVVYNIVSSDNPLYLSEYMPANLLLKYEDKQTASCRKIPSPAGWKSSCLRCARNVKYWPLRKNWTIRSTSRWIKTSAITTCGNRCTSSAKNWAMPRIPVPKRKSMPQKIQDLHLDDESSEEKLLKECERLGQMQATRLRAALSAAIWIPVWPAVEHLSPRMTLTRPMPARCWTVTTTVWRRSRNAFWNCWPCAS